MTISFEHVRKPEAKSVKLTWGNHGLDSTDVHILRQLLQGRTLPSLEQDFRRSFQTLAKNIGVDVDTVRNRMKRMLKIGFIQGWRVILNPHLIGMKESAAWFDLSAEDSKTKILSSLKLVPGVQVIVNFYGPLIIVFFRHEGSDRSLKNRVDLIQRLSNVQAVTAADVPWPKVSSKMTETDWKIVRNIQHDPRKNYVLISKEIGVSTRTVQRRLRRMVEDTMIYNLPQTNYRAIEGTIMAGLIMGLSPQAPSNLLTEITTRLDQYMWYIFPLVLSSKPVGQYWMISLALPSTAKAREILDWARDLGGVRIARMEWMEEQITIAEDSVTVRNSFEKL